MRTPTFKELHANLEMIPILAGLTAHYCAKGIAFILCVACFRTGEVIDYIRMKT